MPRKTRGLHTSASQPWGFNEAAARCRGKPEEIELNVREVIAASMRPRPDAAENPLAARIHLASPHPLQ